MITQNWNYLLRNWFNKSITGVTGRGTQASIIMNLLMTNAVASNYTYSGMGGSSYTFLDVGFGDTPETYGDYQLADSNYVEQKLSIVSAQAVGRGSKDILNVLAIFRNNGAENAVVKEVGIYGNPCSQSQIDNVELLYRKVLDNPVTIAPGESYSFNYIVRLKN